MGLAIQSVSATAGFLEHCAVEFSPRLTCVIGARGTCKSTLIESIRFAFNADKPKIEQLVGNNGDGLIGVTLGAGSIRCQIKSEGDVVTIEREVGGPPRQYQEGVREFKDVDFSHQIEVFSQGELQRIVTDKSADARLSLIDRPNSAQIAILKAKRLIATNKLKTVGVDLRTTRAHVAKLTEELRAEPQLHQQLSEIVGNRPALSNELEAYRQAFERRRKIQQAIEQAVNIETQALSHANALFEVAATLREAASAVTASEEPEVKNALDHIKSSLASIEQAQSGIAGVQPLQLQVLLKQLTADFEKRNEPYFQLRQQQQAANESLKKEEVLKRQLDHMSKVRAEHDSVREREDKLLTDRKTLRQEIAQHSEKMYQLRVTEVGEINREHGQVIFLTLQTGHHSNAYVSRLSNLLSGSRIRTQEEVAADLALKIPPAEFIDLVEAGDARQLAEAIGRDLGQMNRVVAHLADHPTLYDLEADVPEDRLEITMYDDGHPKPVDTLSEGQRATALLPLILRPLPYPLLFDQPEDDLDNSFVFRSMIPTIRKLKSQRQLIFVTHNANIPVLGEADRVVVMSMNGPRNAFASQCGTVDECKKSILDLLEGGAKAFEERERRYGDLLHGDERTAVVTP
jgi:hypothetical protein